MGVHFLKESKMEYKLSFTPFGPTIKKVGYIVQDQISSIDSDDDGFNIYTCRRSACRNELEAYKVARGFDEVGNVVKKPNPYAIVLDVYQHSGITFSIQGEGMQCQFDTASGGTVWVPTKDRVKEIMRSCNGWPVTRTTLLDVCRQDLEYYNAYMNGEVYGYVIDQFEAGTLVDSESCYGMVGFEHAVEVLRGELA
jgi:hypothetical protein